MDKENAIRLAKEFLDKENIPFICVESVKRIDLNYSESLHKEQMDYPGNSQDDIDRWNRMLREHRDHWYIKYKESEEDFILDGLSLNVYDDTGEVEIFLI